MRIRYWIRLETKSRDYVCFSRFQLKSFFSPLSLSTDRFDNLLLFFSVWLLVGTIRWQTNERTNENLLQLKNFFFMSIDFKYWYILSPVGKQAYWILKRRDFFALNCDIPEKIILLCKGCLKSYNYKRIY